jgi:hypothetical protein
MAMNLVAQIELVAPHAVLRHEQPSATALPQSMERDARGRLHHQRKRAL